MRARKITPLLTLSCTAVRLCLLACPHCERTLCEQAPRDASARRVCILVDPAPPFRFASRVTLGHPRRRCRGSEAYASARAAATNEHGTEHGTWASGASATMARGSRLAALGMEAGRVRGFSDLRNASPLRKCGLRG
jgi:hypothetical protein